jgi:hypothetical protein
MKLLNHRKSETNDFFECFSGQSGSGKSHTMLGEQGVLETALAELFRLKTVTQVFFSRSFLVHVSLVLGNSFFRFLDITVGKIDELELPGQMHDIS